MAAKWVGAAMKLVGTLVPPAAERGVAVAEVQPPRLRGQRTPDGVASWLTFHGVDVRRADVTASGAWRSR